VALSVVVTLVDGGAALERCLAGLEAQEGAGATEVIVPFDASADVSEAKRRHPRVRFLDLGAPRSARSIAGEAGRHELYDRRRSAGLAAAQGELVALLEDRGVPQPGWARALAELHASRPAAAIGGAIACGRSDPWARAVHLCDFGRYEPPFEPAPARWLSDTNVAYRREALLEVRALWSERFHETLVHDALRTRGGLWLDPTPLVEQHREGLELRALLAERFHWGRLYAATRARGWGLARRAAFALLAPLLPPLLWLRLVRRSTAAGSLSLAPRILVLLAAWSLGEAAGYATARA
jgi:hypothetical protein